MRILVVNVNTTESMTQAIGKQAAAVAGPDTEIVPLIEDRLKLAGLDARCASVRASGMAVLELESDPDGAVEAIVAQAVRAVEEDNAEVICLGCGGMAGLTEQVVERTGVPVVDGVAAAVTIAESLVRLGLTTSKVRTYAPARPKRFKNWPPIAASGN